MSPGGAAGGPDGPTAPDGCAPLWSPSWWLPLSFTCGTWRRRVGPIASTQPPCKPVPKSWKAFFFGSSDASNFITVDKPPAALWVMELSARVFGMHSWTILAPEALEGVASVGLLYLTVRRWFSPAAGLLAGAALALTPVAALMFRFNNPHALLVLLLIGATYATVRAVEAGRTRWLVLAGSPGRLWLLDQDDAGVAGRARPCCLVYLVAGPTPLGRRVRQLAVAGVALAVSARMVGACCPAHTRR